MMRLMNLRHVTGSGISLSINKQYRTIFTSEHPPQFNRTFLRRCPDMVVRRIGSAGFHPRTCRQVKRIISRVCLRRASVAPGKWRIMRCRIQAFRINLRRFSFHRPRNVDTRLYRSAKPKHQAEENTKIAETVNTLHIEFHIHTDYFEVLSTIILTTSNLPYYFINTRVYLLISSQMKIQWRSNCDHPRDRKINI